MGRDSIDEVYHANNSVGDFIEETDEVPGCQSTNYRIFQKESNRAGERMLQERKTEVSNKHSALGTQTNSTEAMLGEQPQQQSGERGYNHARNMNKCLTLLEIMPPLGEH